MNSMRISSNNNYNLQNSYDQRFNSYQNPNLMSYENSMNFVNQSYNRDNVVYNDFNNIKGEIFLTDYFPPQTSLIFEIDKVSIAGYLAHNID